MKINLLKIPVLPIFLIMLILPLGVSAQSVTSNYDFSVGETHAMEVRASSPLVWQEDQSENFRLNLTLTDFPTNTSYIDIQLIRYILFEADGTVPETRGTNETDFRLEPGNRTKSISRILLPHTSADRFYINVTIIGTPVGGNATQEPRSLSLKFPKSDSIVVERDRLVPVINLYGIPPGSFFSKWLPIYGGLILVMLISPAVYGVHWYRQWREERNVEQSDTEGGEINE